MYKILIDKSFSVCRQTPSPSPSSPSPSSSPEQRRWRRRRVVPVRHDERLVVRTGSAPHPAGGGRRRIRQHHALTADAHIAASLRRLHRVPGQGARHVHVGSRRTRSVRPAVGQHEAGVQGQEEAHVPGQRAVRVTRARRGDDTFSQMMSSPCSRSRFVGAAAGLVSLAVGSVALVAVVDDEVVSLLLFLKLFLLLLLLLLLFLLLLLSYRHVMIRRVISIFLIYFARFTIPRTTTTATATTTTTTPFWCSILYKVARTPATHLAQTLRNKRSQTNRKRRVPNNDHRGRRIRRSKSYHRWSYLY